MVELTALSSRSVRAIATYLNFYVSHDSTAKFLRGSENVIFLEISHCCFQQWKNFQNRLTVDEVIAKSSTPRFLKHCSVESKKCVLWLRNCFFYTKSKNWSRCDRFWMYCMLPCSSLLNSVWFFVTFFFISEGGGGCFNSENTPSPR